MNICIVKHKRSVYIAGALLVTMTTLLYALCAALITHMVYLVLRQDQEPEIVCHRFCSEPDPFSRHFTPAELAQLWKFDESTIRRIFQDLPGVLRIGKSGRRDGKRDYVTLRIPEAVARRVYEERTRC